MKKAKWDNRCYITDYCNNTLFIPLWLYRLSYLKEIYFCSALTIKLKKSFI